MKTITAYNWDDDIEPMICAAMGIEEQYFRNYHKHKDTGVEYCDFWHFCIDALFMDNVANDTITSIYLEEDEIDELLDYMTDEGRIYGKVWGDWVRDIKPGLVQVAKLAEQHDGQLYIQFAW